MKNIIMNNMLNESKIKGVTVRQLDKYDDERGWLSEIWRRDEIDSAEVPAMTYISLTKPGVARGPHEHVDQTDIFGFVGPSTFRLHLWDNREDSETYGLHETHDLGTDKFAVAIIPPGVVHGYTNVGEIDGMVINAANTLYKGEGKTEEVDEIRHEADEDSKFKIH